MINFLRKKYKLIILIIATIACLFMVVGDSVHAVDSPNHEALRMSTFKQSHNSNGGTDAEDLYTIESIIFNKIPFLDPNIFSDKFEEKDENGKPYEGYVKGSINYYIKTELSKWYISLRNITATVILVLGIYNGIRMAISTVADEKAKYKQMLYAWIQSIVLLFFMHYILIIVLSTNGWIVDRMAKEVASTEEASIYYIIKVRAYDIRFSVGMPAMFVYVVLVVMYFKFLWRYVKRFFKILSLIIVAPFIAGRCAFDAPKGKGASKAYRDWLMDFTKTVFIQTIHVVEYIIFMRLAITLIETKFIGFIYAIIFITFMLHTEDIVLAIFNFGDSVNRLAGINTEFRDDFRKIKGIVGLGITYKGVKSARQSFKGWTKQKDSALKAKIDEINEKRRKEKGEYTAYDKAKNKVNDIRKGLIDKMIDKDFSAMNQLDADERKKLKDILSGLQKGDLTTDGLTAEQKDLLSRAGINPDNLVTRNKLKDLVEQRKAQQRFSKDRARTNAELGKNAVRYGYSSAKRKIHGVISNNQFLSRRYQGTQDLLRLKKASLGTGKDAKNAAKAIKLHKEARKKAYAARRQTVITTLKNVGGAGTVMMAAVPVAAINPLLGAAVAAGAAKKFKNAANPVKDYKYGKKEEKAYTKSYNIIKNQANNSDLIDELKKELNGMDDKNEAINSMEKISKFHLDAASLSSLVSQYIDVNKLSEYNDSAIDAGVTKITNALIARGGKDLSSSERSQIESAVEMELKSMLSRVDGSNRAKISTKDISDGIKSAVIGTAVKPEHRNLAEMITEVQANKDNLNDKYDFGKAGVKDLISDLRKDVDNENKFGAKPGKQSKKDSDKEESSKPNRYSNTGADDSGDSAGDKSNKYADADDVQKAGDEANTDENKYSDTGVDNSDSSDSSSNKYSDDGDVSKPGDTDF